MNDYKISVIIPVHNCDQYLPQCLESVLDQTLKDIEIILINDASSDGSQQIIEDHARVDSRIKPFQNSSNKGISATRNTGLEKASGRFVIFLDGDDYWLDECMLEDLYDIAVEDRVDLVSFGYCRIGATGNQFNFSFETPVLVELRGEKNWQIRYNLWAKLISRELLVKHDLHFELSLKLGEDALFSIAVYCVAKRMRVIDKVYYGYRVNLQGVSLSAWNNEKLFDTVRWFAMAIPVIRDSDLFEIRPETLQSLIIERFAMLLNKLGPIALTLLNGSHQQEYFASWADCLELREEAIFNAHFQTSSESGIYRDLLTPLMQKDLDGIRIFFGSGAYRLKADNTKRKAMLSRQQAAEMGQKLLAVDKQSITCDFGSGLIVTLSRAQAQQLAHRLIANREAEITIEFN